MDYTKCEWSNDKINTSSVVCMIIELVVTRQNCNCPWNDISKLNLFKTLTDTTTFRSCQRRFVVRMSKKILLGSLAVCEPLQAHYCPLLDWSGSWLDFPDKILMDRILSQEFIHFIYLQDNHRKQLFINRINNEYIKPHKGSSCCCICGYFTCAKYSLLYHLSNKLLKRKLKNVK